jgi:hypothetical protein
MPLPFSLSGEIAFAKTGSHRHFARAFLDRLERDLARAKARRIEKTDAGLTFSAGLLRPVSSLNPLLIISRGRVEVVGTEAAEVVRYRIDLGAFFAATLVLVALMGLEFSNDPRLLIGMWLFLYGFNVALGIAGFRSMLQGAGRYRYAEVGQPDISGAER